MLETRKLPASANSNNPTVSQVIWNQLIEDAFYSDTPRENLKQLFKMWVEKLTLLSQNVSSEGEPWQRLALTSLVTIEVHARDVIKDLLEKEVHPSSSYSISLHISEKK